MNIADNIEEIRRSIPQEVQLLLASKTQSTQRIEEAYRAGATLFGENKAQELLEKVPRLAHLPLEWHFIGQLQSNKVKMILPYVKLIHSVDRDSLAVEIQKQAENLKLTANILIEVNSSGESNKGGIKLDECEEFINKLSAYSRIKVQGLMTVAIDGSDDQVRDCFRRTRLCFEKVKPLLSGNVLSMGMSGDYKIAIAEGSTIIRLGSSVFGKRS